MKILALFLVVAVSALVQLGAATHTWTGAAGDGRWSTPANWSGGAPAAGEAAPVVLMFPAAGTKNSTNDLSGLTLDQIQISGDNYRLAGLGSGTDVTLRSGNVLSSTFFITGAGAVLTNFNFTIATNVISHASVSVAPGDTATFRCRLIGPGGLIKRASGTLILDGNSANTYAGRTEVHGGMLKLSQSGNAIPGDLIVGLPYLTNLARVELLFQNQIADHASVLVNANGTFAPEVFSETIGSLTLSNADLVAGIGLTLNGPFTSIGTNTATGTVLLGGSDRSFDITGQLTANLFIGNASGFAGIRKDGPGTLILQRTNSYNGITAINEGTLVAAHSGALGTAAVGTQVNDGAALVIQPTLDMPAETLFLLGHGVDGTGSLILGSNTTWQANIQLSTDATINVPTSNSLAIVGASISGAGSLTKIGHGMLQLGGATPNSFQGARVKRGILALGKSGGATALLKSLVIGEGLSVEKTAQVWLLGDNQIADDATVYIDSDGDLNLDGFYDHFDTIGSLTLRLGSVRTGTGQLTLHGDVAALTHPSWPGYGSTISGTVGLHGDPRVFTIQTNTSLSIYGSVVDGGMSSGLHKTGPGSLEFWAGNNSYSGETLIQQGALSLIVARPGSAAGGTIVQAGAELNLWSANVTNESLTINGHGVGRPDSAALHFEGSSRWEGSLLVASDSTILGDSGMGQGNASLVLSGSISGTADLRFRDLQEYIPASVIKLTGASDNTLAGRLHVESGLIELNKTSGAVAIAGHLIIGTLNPNIPATVRLLAHNQIANHVVPFIHPGGTLQLDAFNEAVGGLESDGGLVTGSTGVLTLLGDVWTRSAILGPLKIETPLSLGGGTRTFHVGDDGSQHSINIQRTISDGGAPGGIILNGSSSHGGSTLLLTASNTFTGPVIVKSGRLLIVSDHALGTIDEGTTVLEGAALMLYTDKGVFREPLILHGYGVGDFGALDSRKLSPLTGATNTWVGPITLATNGNGSSGVYITTSESVPIVNNSVLVINGPMSGPADLVLRANGRIVLAGSQPNTYAGHTLLYGGGLLLSKTNATAVPGNLIVQVGTVTLARDHQIHDESSVHVANGTFDLNGHLDFVGSLKGSGEIALGSGTLGIGSTNVSTVATFTGTLTGSGPGTNLIKTGLSRQILTGENPFGGSTRVQGGWLVINGTNSNSSTIVTNNGGLAGTGSLRALTAWGGTVSPGTNDANFGPSFGRLTVLGDATFKAGSKLRVELAGTDAGATHDQLVAGGILNIAGGALQTVLINNGTTTDDRFVVVKSLSGNPTTGSFAGLPEAQIFQPGAGRSFQITYTGGDGNDIVLTQLTAPNPATLGGIVVLSDGTIRLGGTGSPGLTYQVHANTDLNTTNWIHIGTVTADGNGALEFIDNDATSFPTRFYRFMIP